jgi:hypothetical protein
MDLLLAVCAVEADRLHDEGGSGERKRVKKAAAWEDSAEEHAEGGRPPRRGSGALREPQTLECPL